MSRTDVHRPYVVQATDPFNRHRVRIAPRFSDGSGGPMYWPLYNTCGCKLCSGQFARKADRRHQRTQWRTLRQGLLKTAPEDRGDMDVPPPRGSCW